MEKAYFQYFIEDLKEKELLQATIMGHLVIEYMIAKALEVNGYSVSDIVRKNFPKKIELAIESNIIPPNHKDLYLSINGLRNRFAHELDYEPTFEDVHGLVVEAMAEGIDFSDDRIKDSLIAEEEYGKLLCLWEVMGNISLELFLYLDSHGIKLPT